MAVSVTEQLRQLSAGLIAGGALGLGLDVLRRLWRRLPPVPAALADVLYLLSAAVWVFRSGQGSGAANQFFFLSACALGGALYLWGLSPLTEEGLARLEQSGALLWQKMKKITKIPGKCLKYVGILRKKYLCKK